jgi:hypothetical protein
MAYHFFRLLQRAKEVVLVHVLPSDTYGAAEKVALFCKSNMNFVTSIRT